MGRWRWRANLPYRLCDPPVPHVNTRPEADRDPAGNTTAAAGERAPDNRSPRHRDGGQR